MHYVGKDVTAEAALDGGAGEVQVLTQTWEDQETERAPGAILASSFFFSLVRNQIKMVPLMHRVDISSCYTSLETLYTHAGMRFHIHTLHT